MARNLMTPTSYPAAPRRIPNAATSNFDLFQVGYLLVPVPDGVGTGDAGSLMSMAQRGNA